MLALILGGLACLPRQAAGLVRWGRIDGLGAAVLMVFAVSGLLSLLSGDARVLVMKDAVWPLAAGMGVRRSLEAMNLPSAGGAR
jgi:hypothetical protein